jgi:teichuronic acid biosynthesis glycosyltransferase TuaG
VKKDHLVSIITPNYNGVAFLAQTIKSVLDQTYTNWEMIIVDDCSNDNSSAIVQRYAENDKRIKFTQLEKNAGAAITRNKAIELAQGAYIAFLDSDDLWLPDKLEEQLRSMEAKKSTFSHTSYALFDEKNNPLNTRTICSEWITNKDLVKYNWIGTSTVMYNAAVLGKHYMPDLRNRQDWALWLRLIKYSGEALFVDKPLTKYTVRSNSVSSNKLKLIKFHWLIYRQVEKFNAILSVAYLIRNLISHLRKGKFIKYES